MKKLIITLVIALVSSPFFAQTAFDKFDGQDDVTSIVVNKKMFELMSKVKVDTSDKEAQQYMNLIKKLDNLKVFTTKSTAVQGEIKSGAKDTQIKELLMFVEGAKDSDTVLLSLTGNFDLNEISVLTDKMKIPGG